jgi:hypothetical protein
MSSPFGGVAGSEVGSMSFSLDDSSIEMFEESFLDDNSSNMFEESSHDMMEQSSHSSSHSSVDELSNSFGGVDVNDVVDDPDPTPVISDESRDPSIRLEPRRLNFSDVMNDSEESADFIPNQGSLPPSDNNNTFYHDEDVEADEDVASDVDEYEDVEGDHEDDDELPSFDMAEIEDMFHCDVNHFPSPILSGNQGTLLHQVTCSFDVDSIYFVGEGPSQVLEFLAGDGTCTFHSAVNRIYCTQSSRIAIDYLGREDILPNVKGRRLKRLKVICLHHFPNFEIVRVCKGNIEFHLNLHILQPAVLTGNSYMTHELLLTLICALNIAIDGNFPYGEDEEYGMRMEAKYSDDWLTLPFFELQDGSVNQKRMIHNVHKTLRLESAIPFFFRFEQALKLMSIAPELIDPKLQEGNESEYWKKRQGIAFGGSGLCLGLQQLRNHARTLSEKTITVATAAGTKKIFRYPDMEERWVGREHAFDQNSEHHLVDEETMYGKFRLFRRNQFSNIKKELESTFPGLNPDHELFSKVLSFIDVGLEMRPVDDNRLLLADLQRSKSTLASIRYLGMPDVDNVSGHLPDAANLSLHGVGLADEDNVSVESLDSVVSSDEEESNQNEALGGAPSSVMPSDYVDRFLVMNRLSSMNLYRTHFTRTLGNTHTGYVRMNPVDNTSVPYEKVKLAHPSPRFFVGGQIYEPLVRMESMHQQRPKRSHIMSLIPHSVNICRRGGHLLGTTVHNSMKVVAKEMKNLSEVYEHRQMKRQNAKSNVLRMELFVAYTNGDQVVDRLPDFDPTYFVDIFFKEQVDSFEERIVQSHLVPCQKLLGNLGAVLNENRKVEFEKFSPYLRTRFLGSLEISVLYIADSCGPSFIIQSSMLGHGAIHEGITVDFPVSFHVGLSESERNLSGFDFGLQPCLLPLTDNHNGPPMYLSAIAPEDVSSKFPPYFSAMDRSVVRSLNMGMNVGKLERARAQVNAIIHHYSHECLGTESVWNSGVMDEIPYDLLMIMNADDRLEMLQQFARIFIVCYCHSTWELCKKNKVFGDNPDKVVDDDGNLVDPLEFENFPFVERKVRDVTDQLEGTSFVRKDTITSTGKWHCYHCFCMLKLFLFFLTVCNILSIQDTLMKYMIGNSRMVRGVSDLLPKDDAKGWKNDVPRHVYAYIVESFLFVIQDIIGQDTYSNQEEYLGESGYAPFSVDEFNDIIAQSYVVFVTNDVQGEEPIVFHTTEKKRNRNLGWYHVFEYNGTEVPSVPIANMGDEATERIDHRICPDNFWADVCKPLDSQGGCRISLRVMLVGHLLVTRYPKVFTGGTISKTDAKEIHQIQITPDHKVSDLFGDLVRFQENVRNMF